MSFIKNWGHGISKHKKNLILHFLVFITAFILPFASVETWSIVLEFGHNRYWLYTFGYFDWNWGRMKPYEQSIFFPFEVDILIFLANLWILLGILLSLNLFLVTKKVYRIPIGVIIAISVLVTQILFPFLILSNTELGPRYYKTSIRPLPIQSIISIIWMVLLQNDEIQDY